jgi:glycerate 2-kinase
MSVIRNKNELLSHGTVKERRSALDIIEYALSAIDSYKLVRELMRLEGNVLRVASLSYKLSEIGDIYVVGAGKGSSSIAKALEDILGDKIKTGSIIEKRGQGRKLKRIGVVEAGHPVPDEEGVRASKKIIEMTNGAK